MLPQEFDGHPDLGFDAGTSFSTPHVAGVVALMAQKQPLLTQAQAQQTLKTNAIRMESGCRTVAQLLFGELEHSYCWDDDATGAGLVDAVRAVNHVL